MDSMEEIHVAFTYARDVALREGNEFQAWIAEIGILSIAGNATRPPSMVDISESLHFIAESQDGSPIRS